MTATRSPTATGRTGPPIQRAIERSGSSANRIAELPLPSAQAGEEVRLVFRRKSRFENGIR